MDDLSNREFGDYHILRQLGSGATADVFLAEQRSLNRRVALKILKKDLAKDEIYLRRFIREAKAIAALNHPNLVQIYQTDCLDGFWFIAQEYVQGETLQQKIQREGALPVSTVVDILWQIAAAFETATDLGIVHRDIKPENVLLAPNGVVKVTDFGLVHIKSSAERSQVALTEAGMTLGTPLYMSPEQAQGHKLDHRSDIYSLGITCWHALAGKPPFMGGTALSVALQHVNNAPPPLAKQRADIPPKLVEIIEQMIEKTPKNRWQSFHDILETLQKSGLVSDRPLVFQKKILVPARQALQRALDRHKNKWVRLIFSFLIAVSIIFFGWTSGYYYMVWSTPPLPEVQAHDVPRKSTVEEQWIYACFANITDSSPAAWEAVIEYFPEYEYFWGQKAKRQLIRHYYLNDDREHSLPLFQEFAELSVIDLQEQMLGLVGLAWYAALEDDVQMAQSRLNQIELASAFTSDELFIQILDATKKALQQKKRDAASGQPPLGQPSEE